MLSEENISEKLIEEKDRTIKMESKFALPDYLTDLSYLGDSSSDYAGVNAPVSFYNVKNNFKFNNNFVASFARLAINNDGSKLYLLTGADGADITGIGGTHYFLTVNVGIRTQQADAVIGKQSGNGRILNQGQVARQFFDIHFCTNGIGTALQRPVDLIGSV